MPAILREHAPGQDMQALDYQKRHHYEMPTPTNTNRGVPIPASPHSLECVDMSINAAPPVSYNDSGIMPRDVT
eukprot:5065444-Pyramimonas_sp.AAC.1